MMQMTYHRRSGPSQLGGPKLIPRYKDSPRRPWQLPEALRFKPSTTHEDIEGPPLLSESMVDIPQGLKISRISLRPEPLLS